MSNYIKTNYMESPNIGYSEYFIKSKADLSALSPKPGDRAIVADEGKIYFCVTQGSWEKFGNTTSSGSVTIETTIDSTSTNDDVAGAKAVWDLVNTEVSGVEYINNKTTTIDSNSTNDEYPSAAAVYTTVQANKTTIATTIDSTSTNNDAAGAEAIFELVDGLNIKTLTEDTILDLSYMQPGYYFLWGTKVKVYKDNTQKDYDLLTRGILIVGAIVSGGSGIRSFPGHYLFSGMVDFYRDEIKIWGRNVLISGIGQGHYSGVWYPDITYAENIDNKVTTIDSSSTDNEYPSAKAVYDFVTTAISSALQVNENAEIPGGDE